MLAANHVSFLDPVALGVACPRPLSFMARHDLFRNALFGFLISSLNAFPVRRASADRSALKEAVRRLKDGKALVIFPEGDRRGPGEELRDPEPGVAFLAVKADVPVIPAFICGTDKALPKGAHFLRPARISVRLGRPLALSGAVMPYQEAAEAVLAEIRRLAEEAKIGK